MRHEDEVRRRRRLLERLQQRVRRGEVHVFRGSDDRHLGAPAVTRQLYPFDERANAVHGYRVLHLHLTVFVDEERLDHLQVGMLAGHDVAAAGTRAAGESVRPGRLAQQSTSKIDGQNALADAPRAVEQQRMRPGRARGERAGRDVRLPGQQVWPASGRFATGRFGHGQSASSTRVNSARTSAKGRAAFTTRKRAGSSAARSR